MSISAALSARLHDLGRTLEDPHQDLPGAVRAVVRIWHEAVPSFLGLALILTINGLPTTIGTLDRHRAPSVRSTARIPLSAGRHRSIDIIFYAGTPGALVDISADAAHVLELPLDAIIADQDLTPVDSTDPAHSSTIHQATGILIDQGHTPETALPALQAMADAADITLLAAAQQLLHQPPA